MKNSEEKTGYGGGATTSRWPGSIGVNGGPDDLADLNGHIAGVLGGLDSHKSFAAFAGTPMTPSLTTPELFYFGVYQNASAWANGVNAIRSSALGSGGTSMGRWIALRASSSRNGLWKNRQSK